MLTMHKIRVNCLSISTVQMWKHSSASKNPFFTLNYKLHRFATGDTAHLWPIWCYSLQFTIAKVNEVICKCLYCLPLATVFVKKSTNKFYTSLVNIPFVPGARNAKTPLGLSWLKHLEILYQTCLLFLFVFSWNQNKSRPEHFTLNKSK